MALPRVHPLTKTLTDLNRCEIRMEDFLSKFTIEQSAEVNQYAQALDKIREAKALLPKI
jgi:Asp-tRNA(Asn)/Glu-tRNA(Gln) amidotransferase B subunit